MEIPMANNLYEYIEYFKNKKIEDTENNGNLFNTNLFGAYSYRILKGKKTIHSIDPKFCEKIA